MTDKFIDRRGLVAHRKVLTQDMAAPSLTGVRQIFSDHVTHGLTPGRLASILRQTEVGDPHDYLGMAEEIEEKDLHYQSILSTRKRAVCQLELTVEPASDNKNDVANAELVRQALARDDIDNVLFDILDAVGKGFSVSEINWEVSARDWMPRKIIWRDPRWFVFDRADGTTLRLRQGMDEVDLPDYKFIVHFHKAKSGLPIRGGIARAAAWAWMFKNFGIKDWMTFAEVYGQPLRVGKYGPNASDEEKRVLLRAVAQLGTDAAAIIPESMMVEFISAASKSSSDMYERLCNFMDHQMSKAVLGQTTTTDAISGGHAVSREHNEVREDIERADARQLCATLNRQLVVPIVYLNRGPQTAYPKIRLGRSEYTDMTELSGALAQLVPLGLKVSMSEVRGKMGLKEPQDENDVLTPSAVAPHPDKQEMSVHAEQKRGSHVKNRDDIDDVVDKFVDDLQAAAGEDLIQAILDVAERSMDYNDFAESLLELIPNLKMEQLANLVARSTFNARLAGNIEGE